MPAAKTFYSVQEGHWVPLIVPVNITGGKTAPAFGMQNYAHASILIMFGANPSPATKILLNCCDDAAGDSPVAIPFNIFAAETSNVDVLGPRVAVTAAGYTPSGNANIFYVIEIDAAALPQSSPQGNVYLQLQITNGANADFVSAVALLSGARYANDQSPTVLV